MGDERAVAHRQEVVVGGAAVSGLVAIILADTTPFRQDGAKVQGAANPLRTLRPTAGFDPRGSGFLGLSATF